MNYFGKGRDVMIHGGDIYRNKVNMDFSVSLNPLGPQSAVLDAARESLSMAINYPDPRQEEIRDAIAASVGLPAEYVYGGSGASELMLATVRAVQPRRALLFEPGFSGYEHVLKAAGCEAVRHPLKSDEGFRLSFEDAEAMNEEVDIVFVCDPANPTGATIEDAVFLKIMERARDKGIYVCLDESFFFLSDKASKGNLRNRSDLVKNFDNLIILRSLTKVLAVPGIRMGYVLSAPANIEKIIDQLPEWNLSVTGESAMRAGLGLICDTDFISRSAAVIDEERAYMEGVLKELGYKVFDSTTCFILFKGPPDLYDKLLEKGILIRDCTDYVGLSKGYYRIAVKEHSDNEELARALREAADEL